MKIELPRMIGGKSSPFVRSKDLIEDALDRHDMDGEPVGRESKSAEKKEEKKK